MLDLKDYDINQACAIIHELSKRHTLLAWNEDTRSLISVNSICINGDAIQLNLTTESCEMCGKRINEETI